jgi:hypothetical protein
MAYSHTSSSSSANSAATALPNELPFFIDLNKTSDQFMYEFSQGKRDPPSIEARVKDWISTRSVNQQEESKSNDGSKKVSRSIKFKLSIDLDMIASTSDIPTLINGLEAEHGSIQSLLGI